MTSQWLPPHATYQSVTFSIKDSEIISKTSYVNVTSQAQLSAEMPVPEGVYDSRMGTFDKRYLCTTCGGKKDVCRGHYGSINLGPARVYSPMYIKKIVKWLKVICPKCYRNAYSDDEINSIPPHTRLEKLSANAAQNDKLKPCVHCNAERYSVRRLKEDESAVGWITNKKTTERINTREVDHIFNNYSMEDAILMGQGHSHPKKYVLSAIPVAPVTARPETHAIKNGRVRINDQTFFAKMIIAGLASNKDNDITLNQYYFESVYGPPVPGRQTQNTNQPKAIKTLLPGKENGLVRKNLLAKRTYGTTRLVINGDSALEANQVGIPLNVAKKLSVPEIVDISNRDRLMRYFINGQKTYPGCKKIIKADGTEWQIIETSNIITLEIGDTIWRDMVDGDDILINRAPSLLPSSEIAMKCVIHNDNTMKFNVFICVLFNADFDGDAMTGYVMQSDNARIEAQLVSHIDQFMISHKHSNMFLGQVQDSVVGMAQITQNGVKYNKLSAMRVLGRTKLNPKLTETQYSGRDLITMTLKGDGININYSRKANIFKEESHLPFILREKSDTMYSKDEMVAVIENGVHLSGILDKSAISGGVNSSLYHVIYSQYGARKSLDALYNMQQIAIGHLQTKEITVSFGDLLPDHGASMNPYVGEGLKVPADTISVPSVEELIKVLYIENEKQIEILDKGDILPPIGQTVEEHFKNIQINLARKLDTTKHMMCHINPLMNNFYKMISFGSKGKFPNLQLMMEAIGLILVNEKMPSNKFGYKRTLPYFRKCELSLPSRGFVASSYVSGMNVAETFFNAMSERHSIIMKALFTAVVGAESRTAGKNLESIIINNLRQTGNGPIILQPIYGGDGVDTRKLIQVQFPTLLISDKALEEGWGGFGEYTEKIKADRQIIRESFMTIYKSGNYDIMSGNIMAPFDPRKIADAKIKEQSADNKKTGDIKKKIERVMEFSSFDIYYVMMNDTAMKLKAEVPTYLATAVTLYAALIRATLRPSVLEKLSADQLEEVLLQIKYKYQHSLIDYGMAIGLIASQCSSEPLTQYVLHSIHHAVSGGTKKGGVARFNEIISPSVEDIPNSSMTIYMKDSSVSAKFITTNIQILKFKEFISFGILVEEPEYGKIIHPDLKDDELIFQEFRTYFPLITPPANLVRWFYRFTINKEKLFSKNISLLKIIDSLRKEYKNAFIIHNNENSETIVIRMYWKANEFSNYPEKLDMDLLEAQVADTTIRGIEGVSNAYVEKENMLIEIAPADHPDAGAIIKEKKEFVINTSGSNIYGLLKSPISKYIDPLRIISDSIIEVWDMFGIEEAKLLIIEELRKNTPEVNIRHIMIYATEMCSSGIVTSIKRSGLKARHTNDILLRIAHQAPLQPLVYAGENNITAPISCPSADLIMGRVPNIGTHYNKLIINEEFIRQNTVSAEQQLDELGDI